jgi:hypothetical protein
MYVLAYQLPVSGSRMSLLPLHGVYLEQNIPLMAYLRWQQFLTGTVCSACCSSGQLLLQGSNSNIYEHGRTHRGLTLPSTYHLHRSIPRR